VLNVFRVSILILAVCVGACGAEGTPGPTGPQGPKGDPGTLLQSITSCDSNIIQVNGLSLGFSVYRWDFSDGSVMVECFIEDGQTTFSTMDLYKSTMPGAARGACVLMYDVDVVSGGYWRFAVAKGGVEGASSAYVDPGSTSNNRAVTFGCENR
jgi:hypothetical protein